jgi:hypothetical protein
MKTKGEKARFAFFLTYALLSMRSEKPDPELHRLMKARRLKGALLDRVTQEFEARRHSVHLHCEWADRVKRAIDANGGDVLAAIEFVNRNEPWATIEDREAWVAAWRSYEDQCDQILKARERQKFGPKKSYSDWEVGQACSELEAENAFPPEPPGPSIYSMPRPP